MNLESKRDECASLPKEKGVPNPWGIESVELSTNGDTLVVPENI
jgi:hypothetical protein